MLEAPNRKLSFPSPNRRPVSASPSLSMTIVPTGELYVAVNTILADFK